MVLKYMLGKVSTNREQDLSNSMKDILSKIDTPVLDVIKSCSGLEDSLL